MMFNSDGDNLLTTSFDGSVRVWIVNSGEIKHNIQDTSQLMSGLYFSQNACVIANVAKYVRVVDLNTPRFVDTQQLKLASVACSLTFDDAGRFLLAGTRDGHVEVLKVAGPPNA